MCPVTSPFKPAPEPIFVTMLMIPDVPSAVNRAEGFVITLDLLDVGCRELLQHVRTGSCPSKPISLPLIRTSTSVDPRKLTLPSMSTWTDGIFFKTSLTELDLAIRSWSTLYTLRSFEWL